jgi:hypothetical protein
MYIDLEAVAVVKLKIVGVNCDASFSHCEDPIGHFEIDDLSPREANILHKGVNVIPIADKPRKQA